MYCCRCLRVSERTALSTVRVYKSVCMDTAENPLEKIMFMTPECVKHVAFDPVNINKYFRVLQFCAFLRSATWRGQRAAAIHVTWSQPPTWGSQIPHTLHWIQIHHGSLYLLVHFYSANILLACMDSGENPFMFLPTRPCILQVFSLPFSGREKEEPGEGSFSL